MRVLESTLQVTGLPPRARAELIIELAQVKDLTGKSDEARALLLRALPEMEDCPDIRIKTMTMLAWPWIEGVPIADHLRWLDEAVLEAESGPDELLCLSAHIARASVLISIGRWGARGDAELLLERIPSPGADKERARLLVLLAEGAWLVGDYAHAAEYSERCRRLCESLQLERFRIGLDLVDVLVLWATGRWAEIDEPLERLKAISSTCPRALPKQFAVAGHLSLARGDNSQGLKELKQSIDYAQASGDLFAHAMAAGFLDPAQGHEDETQLYRKVLADSIELIRAKGVWLWGADLLPAFVQSILHEGLGSKAEALLAEVREGLTGVHAPHAMAALCFCEGLLDSWRGEHERATSEFQTAESMWGEIGRPYEQALSLEQLGLLHADALRADVARECLVASLSILVNLGAKRDERRLRMHLKRIGIRAPYPLAGGRPSYGDELSPQEQKVVPLIREGLTNQEIAERLVLSPKTIEKHVSSVMRKLRISSRKELMEPRLASRR